MCHEVRGFVAHLPGGQVDGLIAELPEGDDGVAVQPRLQHQLRHHGRDVEEAGEAERERDEQRRQHQLQSRGSGFKYQRT